MKLKLLAAGLLMVGSSAAFANAPMTFADIDALQSHDAMHLAPLTVAEMEQTEGNAVPLVAVGIIGAAAAGGVGHLWNSPDPSLVGVAWGIGTGLTGAAIIATAPTFPLWGGVAATLGGSLIAVAPMPTWDPILTSCSIFGGPCR